MLQAAAEEWWMAGAATATLISNPHRQSPRTDTCWKAHHHPAPRHDGLSLRIIELAQAILVVCLHAVNLEDAGVPSPKLWMSLEEALYPRLPWACLGVLWHKTAIQTERTDGVQQL